MAHVEFHRRHQSAKPLAIDVGEAQIRLYRREGVEVVSLVWDLYGTDAEPVIDERSFAHGAKILSDASRTVYLRINLRGLDWQALLASAPSALWPLVALAKGGTSRQAVHEARDAIERRTDLTPAQRADHMAVLWFIAEAEDVPVQVMKEYITEERLMASTLYQSIFEKGQARGQVENQAGSLMRVLTRKAGTLDESVVTRIRAVTSIETLDAWFEEALDLTDADSARRLIDKITQSSTS